MPLLLSDHWSNHFLQEVVHCFRIAKDYVFGAPSLIARVTFQESAIFACIQIFVKNQGSSVEPLIRR